MAAWPTLALLVTVELTSRVPMHHRLFAVIRVVATVVIVAGIAGWISYGHMRNLATAYGESSLSSYLLPLSVDGLIVVASVSLVELAARIRQLEPGSVAADGGPQPSYSIANGSGETSDRG